MNRLEHLIFLITILIIFLGMICKSAICTWFYLNVVVSIYELYIIYNRQKLKKSDCEDSFWEGESEPKNLARDYWNDYACKTDERYFENNNYVFIFEGLNVVATILLGLAIIKNKFIGEVLTFQFLNAAFYFVTLKEKSGKLNYIYKSISAIWLAFPTLLMYKLSRNP